MNLRQFIEINKIDYTRRTAMKNPSMPDMPRNFYFSIVNRTTGNKMGVYFSQGAAHTKPPTLDDVLDCLASDAAGIESAKSFEDWCGDYGYDTDSRKSEKIWKACSAQADKLKSLLGEEYETLLWKIERE
jgi:hypothetical protein